MNLINDKYTPQNIDKRGTDWQTYTLMERFRLINSSKLKIISFNFDWLSSWLTANKSDILRQEVRLTLLKTYGLSNILLICSLYILAMFLVEDGIDCRDKLDSILPSIAHFR